jgi:hypothetical protein
MVVRYAASPVIVLLLLVEVPSTSAAWEEVGSRSDVKKGSASSWLGEARGVDTLVGVREGTERGERWGEARRERVWRKLDLRLGGEDEGRGMVDGSRGRSGMAMPGRESLSLL